MKLQVTGGTTNVSVVVFIQDSSSVTGDGLTGLVWNTAGLTATFYRPGDAAHTAITLATLATLNAAYASGGFKEVSAALMPGVYRFDIPDAVFAAGVHNVNIMLQGAANMVNKPFEIQLITFDISRNTAALLAATQTQIDDIETDAANAASDADDLLNTAIGEIATMTDVPADPTIAQAVRLNYTYRRNQIQASASELRLHDDSDTEILDATITEAAGVTTRGKLTNP